MPVYFIVYLNIIDPDQFTKYYHTVLPVIERRGGRIIGQGIPETIEGAVSWQQAVVFEWPSRQDFLNYWHSEEYAEIKKLRDEAADFQDIIVDSV